MKLFPLFSKIGTKLDATWGIKKEFRLKVFFLTLAFFMLTACQAIWRPLKSAVFISIVGVKHIPDAKLLLMLPLILLIILYSKLVDWLRRHHLFYWFTIAHGLVGIIMYYYLSHPVYGLANTLQSPSRIFGWSFYLFLESFGAFMSAVFWSFANSVNNPKDAKNHYSLFVCGSKIGGIMGAGTLFFATYSFDLANYQTVVIPRFVLVGSLLLFGAAAAIYLLMRLVPGYLMHGYEAAYQFEKQKDETKGSKTVMQSLKESLDGIILIVKNPYVFGIFSLILSYEVIIVIFDYLVAIVADSKHLTATGLANFYSIYTFCMHSVGLVIALFGTTPLLRFLGIRLSLFVCPILSLIILTIALLFPTPTVIFASLIVLRALNYGLNHPTREALFIPTTKSIKFKAKAWTDAFGSRIAKATGSLLNKSILLGVIQSSTLFTIALSTGWIGITYFMGKKFQRTVDNNEVIGADESES
ncbi:hypothetical protein KKA53_03585 [Candidatus Dependentiae bacterium]|nr:hypothetical protein [Candidatus Dependentiae bacterium]